MTILWSESESFIHSPARFCHQDQCSTASVTPSLTLLLISYIFSDLQNLTVYILIAWSSFKKNDRNKVDALMMIRDSESIILKMCVRYYLQECGKALDCSAPSDGRCLQQTPHWPSSIYFNFNGHVLNCGGQETKSTARNRSTFNHSSTQPPTLTLSSPYYHISVICYNVNWFM